MTIGWIEISKKKYGGVVYDGKAKDILAESFDLDLINLEARYFKKIKYLKIPESLFYLSRLREKKDLWVRDFFATLVFSPKKTKGKNLVVVHHLDFSGFPWISKPFLNFLKKFYFYPNLKKADAVVTVSEYWKCQLQKRGYKNVYKIYNSFNLSDFNISSKEVTDFKKKYGLQDKPIVYLGNCQKAKGVVKSYKALKGLNIYLITSGRRQVRVPALNLNLEYRDYLKLLKSASLAVTMSEFEEGWSRTTHEAMLSRTPVVGSGCGGMKELLEGGKQIVCEDFGKLREKVEYLLENPDVREKMAEDGHLFAEKFSQDKFKEEWINLIKKICG